MDKNKLPTNSSLYQEERGIELKWALIYLRRLRAGYDPIRHRRRCRQSYACGDVSQRPAAHAARSPRPAPPGTLAWVPSPQPQRRRRRLVAAVTSSVRYFQGLREKGEDERTDLEAPARSPDPLGRLALAGSLGEPVASQSRTRLTGSLVLDPSCGWHPLDTLDHRLPSLASPPRLLCLSDLGRDLKGSGVERGGVCGWDWVPGGGDEAESLPFFRDPTFTIAVKEMHRILLVE